MRIRSFVKVPLFLSLGGLFVGCSPNEPLVGYTEPLSVHPPACYLLETPDPYLKRAWVGERIQLRYSYRALSEKLERESWCGKKELRLIVRREGHQEDDSFVIPLQAMVGIESVEFPWCMESGIGEKVLCYRAELNLDEVVVAQFAHPLWHERIVLSEE